MVESSPKPAPLAYLPPRRFGRYEVIAELAKGGMGVVYLARQSKEAGFQRLFAVKTLHPHLAEDESFVDMLRDEARIAARLHHPNVVPIVDLGSQDGMYYAVMEYVEGVSLAALLRRSPKERPVRLLVPIFLDALEGLHAAHTLTDDAGKPLNLIHRDISPQNILIGLDGAARITDFGIAKAEARATSTQPGVFKGKIAYIAPEQLDDANEPKVDRRADIFSLGATLWTALTGQRLFRGSSDASTIRNILGKDVAKPSEVGLKPPVELDSICLKALEREPDRRYATAQAMADALREIAIEQGLLGSRAEVAEWMASKFTADFDKRRRAIQDAAQHPLDDTQEDSVPALPSISGAVSYPPGSLPPGVAGSVSSPAGVPSIVDSSPPATPLSEQPSDPPSPFATTKVSAAPTSRRWLALLLLLLGLGVVLLVWLVLLGVNDAKVEAAAQTPEAARPPAPSVSGSDQAGHPELDPEPPITPPTASIEVVSPETLDLEKPAPARIVKKTPRAASKPAPEDKPPVKAEPKPPVPKARPKSGIERNPYLRQQ